MSAAAAAAARGPMGLLLQNSSYQWLILGTGVYLVAPDHLKESIHRGLLAATAGNGTIVTTTANHQPHHDHRSQHGPIVLRMEGGHNGTSGNHRSLLGTVVTITICVGGVWITYALITGVLPDHLKQFLPATRKALDVATEKLAGSLLKIKNVLGSEMQKLLQRQNDLEDLQRDMGKGIDDLQDRMEHVGDDVTTMHATVDRCEVSLEQTRAMQEYTGRGVKLLVTAVQAMSSPHDQINKELQNYLRAGDLLFPSITLKQQQQQVGPEDDRPQLTRSTSSSSSTTTTSKQQQQRRRLTPTITEEEHQQLHDIRHNRLTDRVILTTTPAM